MFLRVPSKDGPRSLRRSKTQAAAVVSGWMACKSHCELTLFALKQCLTLMKRVQKEMTKVMSTDFFDDSGSLLQNQLMCNHCPQSHRKKGCVKRENFENNPTIAFGCWVHDGIQLIFPWTCIASTISTKMANSVLAETRARVASVQHRTFVLQVQLCFVLSCAILLVWMVVWCFGTLHKLPFLMKAMLESG